MNDTENQNMEDADCSPYMAMTAGKNPEELTSFFERFSKLPPPIRSFFTSLDVIAQIKDMNIRLGIPPTHTIAISKIIAFVALGDVSVSSIEDLLLKLNIAQPLAKDLSNAIGKIMEPVIAERAQASVPQAMEKLPPMTPTVPPVPGAGTQTSARNIIDLRKQQPQQ